MKKVLLVLMILTMIIILLTSCSQQVVNKKSSPEQITSYLIDNIWDLNKQDKVIHAIELFMNSESDNKMQLAYEIVTKGHMGSNYSDSGIKRLIFQGLDKENYVNDHIFVEFLNKYTETYFTTQDDVLADIIIDCFNYNKLVFFTGDSETLAKKIVDLPRDITEAECLMIENITNNSNFKNKNNTTIEPIILYGLFTRLHNNMQSRVYTDYENYFDMVKGYFRIRYSDTNSIDNVIDTSKEMIDLQRKMDSLNKDNEKLTAENGYKITPEADRWIQAEYEKAQTNEKLMNDLIALMGSEEKAKTQLMGMCIDEAKANGLFIYNDNGNQIEINKGEISELQEKLSILNETLENEINNITSKYGTDTNKAIPNIENSKDEISADIKPFNEIDWKFSNGLSINMTEEEVKKILGNSISREEYYDELWSEESVLLKYENAKVDLFKTPKGEYRVKSMAISGGADGPRKIELGDSSDTVISKFPHQDIKKTDQSYFLYGNVYYETNGQVTLNEDGTIKLISYFDEPTRYQLVFNIMDDKVTEINIGLTD